MKGSKLQIERIKIAIFLTLSVTMALPAQAEYDADLGGWTEIIGCPASSWDVCPVYHDEFYWGGSGPDLVYTSPANWWNYADPDSISMTDGSLNCGQWINGSIVGGATYEPGELSVPQGVDVSIDTEFWDFTSFDWSTQCGHQHVSTYVWGWRYTGNSWIREFVKANNLTAYPNANGVCEFKGENNPDYASLPAHAFGPNVLQINNSPYAVLHTKSQATSHAGAHCGQFECYHPVRVEVSYEGGPGVNEAKLVYVPPTDELTVEQDKVKPFRQVTNPETLTLKLNSQKSTSQRSSAFTATRQ